MVKLWCDGNSDDGTVGDKSMVIFLFLWQTEYRWKPHEGILFFLS